MADRASNPSICTLRDKVVGEGRSQSPFSSSEGVTIHGTSSAAPLDPTACISSDLPANRILLGGGASPSVTRNSEGSDGQQRAVGPFVTRLQNPLDQCTEFWDAYNKTSDTEDKESLKALGGDLDVLLIFAGLFSATNTAFIIDSYKNLKADPAQETIELLRSVFITLQNSSATGLATETKPFIPDGRDVRINACFFTSLCCSLSAAFGAVLAKQWLAQYGREAGGPSKSPCVRGRDRQRKYEGRAKWYLEDVVQTLPTLLQLSLFFFLVGLVDFLWPLSTLVASIIIAFTVVSFIFYTTTISIALADLGSPFQTRLSLLLRPICARLASTLPVTVSRLTASITRRFHKIIDTIRWSRDIEPYRQWPSILFDLFRRSLFKSTACALFSLQSAFTWLFRRLLEGSSASTVSSEQAGRSEPSFDSRCVIYLLERMTLPENLPLLVGALDTLTDDSAAVAAAEAFITLHLKPSYRHWWHLPGLYGVSRRPLLEILHILIVKWRYLDKCPAVITPFSPLNTPALLVSLRLELWKAFLVDPNDLQMADLITEILLALPSPEEYPGLPISILSDTIGCHRDAMSRNLEDDTNLVAQKSTMKLLCLTAGLYDIPQLWNLLVQGARTSHGIRDILQSTMWEADGPVDADGFWMATLRVQVLSALHLESAIDPSFAEYLSLWFSQYGGSSVNHRRRLYHQAIGSFRRQWFYWSYILSLRHLLTQGDAHTQARNLRRHGHYHHLHTLLQQFPHDHQFQGAPLGLHSFLCLWVHDRSDSESGEEASEYLTEQCVQTVLNVLKSQVLDLPSIVACMNETGQIFMQEKEGSGVLEQLQADMCEIIDWLALYLEAAVIGGLLTEGDLAVTLSGFRSWCQTINGSDLSTNRCNVLSERLHDLVK